MRLGLSLLAAGAALSATPGTVPYFPSASDPDRQGFVRVIIHSVSAGELLVVATDDAGSAFDAVVVPIGSDETVHFNSDDLETGSVSKGIGGIGGGEGDWRIEIASDLAIEALAYIRTNDGFLTPMLDVVPRIGNRHRIATFNPASNVGQKAVCDW